MRQRRLQEWSRQFHRTSNISRAGYNAGRPCTPRRHTGYRQQLTLSLGILTNLQTLQLIAGCMKFLKRPVKTPTHSI